MTQTDFFDDDLIQKNDSSRFSATATPERSGGYGDQPGYSSHGVSDQNNSKLARHKDDVDGQVARAAEELERLRKRQEDLEKEKRDLQDLRRRQEQYESGKREMSEQLNRSLLTLEREEIRANQIADLYCATRTRFKDMFNTIESLDSEAWPENMIREELSKALALIDDTRVEYKKAMAKIQAISEREAKSGAENQPSVILEETSLSRTEPHSFFYWLKVGLAISIPLIITFVVLTIVSLIFRSQGLI